MKVLRIFDVSTFVHAGAVNRHSFVAPGLVLEDDGYRERRIYTGGVSLLWNTLYDVYGTCDLAFCCDTRPTVKQDMFDGYKATRPHNPEKSKMKKACQYILEDCGLEVLCKDGYEADDFIYSLVRDKKKEYDHIYIYTADSDLYFLVDDNVTILPSSSRAKKVTKQNYTYTAGKKDSYTPYNSMTFTKILEGDKSDNIPGLSDQRCRQLYSIFYNDLYFPYMGDKETMMHVLTPFGEDVKSQCELVFPLDVRTPSEFKKGDKLRIAEWGNAVKNKLWLHNKPLSKHILDCIEEMAELGYYAEE